MNKTSAALLLLLLARAAAAEPVTDAAAVSETPADTAEAPAAPKPSLFKRIKNKFNKEIQAVAGSEEEKLQYPVTIEAQPDEIREMLEEHLPLITQQAEEKLDDEQMSFLAEEAPQQVLMMLKTKGYFNAKATVVRQGAGYAVKVDSGVPTKIDKVGVNIGGDILNDDDLGGYYRDAMANWALPVGSTFTQDDWGSSKTAVLTAVRRKKYPLASFAKTQATINPDQHTADVSVAVDSGSPVYFGEFEISGNKRYPESVVRGLAQFDTGSPYDLDKLLDYQQALEQDSHYSGASVQADFERIRDGRVPVKVNVSETKRQKLEMGLRFDSEYGAGGRLAYDYYDLFGKGYIGSAVADLDRYERIVAVGISQPRKSDGHYWTSNLSYNHSTAQKLEKDAWSSGLWYVRDRNGIEARLGVEFIGEKARIPESGLDLGRSHATMLTVSWKRQNIQTLMRPENGYYLDGKFGTTLGKLLSSSSMQRFYGRAGYFFTPEDKKIGTFVLRGQVGYVYTNNEGQVPSSLRFRTGGSTSVRGYEQDSIGLPGPSDSVLPERAMFSASMEYQYPISKSFSAAVFHDVGDTARNFSQMNVKHGTGVGVRWFSPIAPFSFDIAYGHQDKKIRWHISLGTRF
ncbi:MAG: autotransporter assembly complex family protein [Neisseria sp.]|nr:autotransporter assembly complex family protein [Neisseria sp.]